MLAVVLPAPANMTLGQGQCTGHCIVCLSHQQHTVLIDARMASTPADHPGDDVQTQTVYETRVQSALMSSCSSGGAQRYTHHASPSSYGQQALEPRIMLQTLDHVFADQCQVDCLWATLLICSLCHSLA